MINVGIIGCGFVGGALKDWLEHNNPECKLFISDPAKGYHDDLSHGTPVHRCNQLGQPFHNVLFPYKKLIFYSLMNLYERKMKF